MMLNVIEISLMNWAATYESLWLFIRYINQERCISLVLVHFLPLGLVSISVDSERLQLNPSKWSGYGLETPLYLGVYYLWSWSCTALDRPVCDLGVLLDSWLLLKKVAVVAFAQLWVMQCLQKLSFHSFMPWSSHGWIIVMHSTWGYPRRVSRSCNWCKMQQHSISGLSRVMHVTPLLFKLH